AAIDRAPDADAAHVLDEDVAGQRRQRGRAGTADDRLVGRDVRRLGAEGAAERLVLLAGERTGVAPRITRHRRPACIRSAAIEHTAAVLPDRSVPRAAAAAA